MVRAYDIRPTPPLTLWTTSLPGILASLFSTIVTTLADLNQLFVGLGGVIFRLDAKTGSIIWQRDINMLASTNPTIILNGSYLIVAVAGTVATLDKETGTVIWTKSLGPYATSLLSIPNQLLAGTRGQLYSLHPMTGKELWKNSLEGCGYSPITLSCSSSQKRILAGTGGYIVPVSLDGKSLSKKIALEDSTIGYVSQIPYGSDTIIQHSRFVFLISDDGKEKWRVDLRRSGGASVLRLHENSLWVGLFDTLFEIHPSTGEQLRDVTFGQSLLSMGVVDFVNFVFVENFAYVSVRGKFYKVDLKAPGGMKSVWEDELPGFGYIPHYLSCYDQNQIYNQAPLGACLEHIRG